MQNGREFAGPYSLDHNFGQVQHNMEPKHQQDQQSRNFRCAVQMPSGYGALNHPES